MAEREAYKFTKGARDTFLASLAATADVGRSAAAAGVVRNTVYKHRRRDAQFAYEWRMALLAGYDQIELALIRKALGLPIEKGDADDACARTGELDVELALKLLTRRKPIVDEADRVGKAEAFRASRDAAAAALLLKLKAHAKRGNLAQDAETARIVALPSPRRRITSAKEQAPGT